MAKGKDIQQRASRSEVDQFLRRVAATPRPRSGDSGGRLIFAMDATASREPSWDQASQIQAAMFSETRDLGGLEVQLVYYRGYLELEVSPWCRDSAELLPRMTRVHCAAGLTQIGRVLRHARDEARNGRVDALVLVGDAMEEGRDALAGLAGELGLVGVPAFVFQEGRDATAEASFRDIARLTGGAWCPFDAASPRMLHELLSAVAVFAAGGRKALEDLGRRRGGAVLQLTRQIRRS